MYVVFGATGQTGSVAATTLLEKGLPVRVVLHSSKAATAWQARGAEVVLADVLHVDTVAEALRAAIPGCV
jgi:uncharacterized protein YbjT (DUF2867 family)